MEELNISIHDLTHYYTTDFFQPTTLLPSTMQLLNIYYQVKTDKPFTFPVTGRKNDFTEIIDGAQCFRWLNINRMTEDDFTFPIDKYLVHKLQQDFGSDVVKN